MQFEVFFISIQWVQLMKTLNVRPTRASDSTVCWIRDLLAEEPSIKRRITLLLSLHRPWLLCRVYAAAGSMPRTETPAPVLAFKQGCAKKVKEKAGNSIPALLRFQFDLCLQYCSWKLCHNLVSIPDIQNKQCAYKTICFWDVSSTAANKEKTYSLVHSGKVGKSWGWNLNSPTLMGILSSTASRIDIWLSGLQTRYTGNNGDWNRERMKNSTYNDAI